MIEQFARPQDYSFLPEIMQRDKKSCSAKCLNLDLRD
jgi:hypothetical protein